MKKFFLYLVRWQLSSPILAVCMVWMGGWNVAIATIVANLIGGCIFFWVDRWIFGDRKSKIREKRVLTAIKKPARAETLAIKNEELN